MKKILSGILLLWSMTAFAVTWPNAFTTNQFPVGLSYLNFNSLPQPLKGNSWAGIQQLMARLENVINYTNILPLANTNTVDTRLIDLLTNSAYGTCIVLSNGVYNVGNAKLVMNPGVMMIGQSVSNVIVYKQGNSGGALTAGITGRRDCCLANFTFYESASATFLTSGIAADPAAYQDNFGMLLVNLVVLCDSDSARFANFNGELRSYNCWFESHWDGWVMDGIALGARLMVYNDYHYNNTRQSIHTLPDGNRPMRSAAYLTAYYSTFVAIDSFTAGDGVDAICVGPCGSGVFLGDCSFSLTTGADNAQGDQVGQVFGVSGAAASMTIVSGGSYDATKFQNKVRILQ